MSTNPAQTKRHRMPRLHGERRGKGETGSSRDASEEDNDVDMSDVGSVHSFPASSGAPHPTRAPFKSEGSSPLVPQTGFPPTGQPMPGPARRSANQRRVEELAEGSMSEGVESPTYDGDVESASTVGGTPIHSTFASSTSHNRHPSSPTSISPPQSLPINDGSSPTHAISPAARVPTPKPSRANLVESPSMLGNSTQPAYNRPVDVPVHHSDSLEAPRKKQTEPLSKPPSMANLSVSAPKMVRRPIELPEEDIRAFVQRAVDGEGEVDGVHRNWRTRAPEDGKVVRIYADGVYDLFHFGHALQLRQAKLSFPKVHLIVGVCSDALCAANKSAPAMTHAERCESLRHCRWVDEVFPDAPWVIDQAFVDRHRFDYIAHDEEVYPSAGHQDIYEFAKKAGMFVPTRRTPAVSTSELLERIVRGYRDGFFDTKLEKNGHPELVAADVDWDSAASQERRARRSREGKARADKLALAQGQETTVQGEQANAVINQVVAAGPLQ